MEVTDTDNGFPPGRPITIISVQQDGRFYFDSSKLKEVLSEVDKVPLDNIKVAMICVIGQKQSGKSFLTNLILEHLATSGSGHWIGDVTQKNRKLEGFSWNVKEDEIANFSSVSIYSRPFNISRCSGEKIIVFVLDCFIRQDDIISSRLLNSIVWSLCTTVIVNRHEDFHLDFLSLRQEIIDCKPLSVAEQVFCVIQNLTAPVNQLSLGKLTSKKFEKFILDHLKSENRQDLISVWQNINNPVGFILPTPGNSIIDENGFLDLPKNYITYAKKLVDLVLDEDEIYCTPYANLVAFQEFIQKSVNWVNTNLNNSKSMQVTEKDDAEVPNNHNNGAFVEITSSPPQKVETCTVEQTKTNSEEFAEENHVTLSLQEMKSKENKDMNLPNCFTSDSVDSAMHTYDPSVELKCKAEIPLELKDSFIEVVKSDTLELEYKSPITAPVATAPESNSSTAFRVSIEIPKLNINAVQMDTAENFTSDSIVHLNESVDVESQETVASTVETGNTQKEISTNSNEAVLKKEDAIDATTQPPESKKKKKRCRKNKNSKAKNGNTANGERKDSLSDSVDKTENVNIISADSGTIHETNLQSAAEHNDAELNIVQNAGERENSEAGIEKIASSSLASDKHSIVEHFESEINTDLNNLATKSEQIENSCQSATELANSTEIVEDLISFEENTCCKKDDGHKILSNDTQKEMGNGGKNKSSSNSEIIASTSVTISAEGQNSEKNASRFPLKEENAFNFAKGGSSAVDNLNDPADKQLEDDILQNYVHKIKKSYEEAMNDFLQKNPTASTDTLRNAHSRFMKNAVMKLQGFHSFLIFSPEIQQENLKVLKTRLDMQHAILSKKLRKQGQLPKVCKNEVENANEISIGEACTENVAASDEAKVLQAFEERCEKLLETYQHEIVQKIQTGGSQSDLREVHQQLCRKQIKYLKEIFNGDNISDKLNEFQTRLDSEFSNHISIPEGPEENFIRLSEEELQAKIIDGQNHFVLVLKGFTDRLIQTYNGHMNLFFTESRNSTITLEGLRFKHQELISSLDDPELWDNYYDLQSFISSRNFFMEHYKYLLGLRLQCFESHILKNQVTRTFLQKLVAACAEIFNESIFQELSTRIANCGFSSVPELIDDVHKKLVNDLVQKFCPVRDFFDIMKCMITESVKDKLMGIKQLETIFKVYDKQMRTEFKKQPCFSEEQLNVSHEKATTVALNDSLVKFGSQRFREVSCAVVNFAKVWYVNHNINVQKSEANTARHIIDMIKNFHDEQMKKMLVRQFHSRQYLKTEHEELRNRCVEAFKRCTRFQPVKIGNGLNNFEEILSNELEERFDEYSVLNEKNVENASKIVQKIAAEARKTFLETMNGELERKSFATSEFDELYRNTSENILEKMTIEIGNNVQNENLELFRENLENIFKQYVAEMRIANDKKAMEEKRAFLKENKEKSLEEAARGCVTPSLLIEFGVNNIKISHLQENFKCTYIKNADGDIIRPNVIHFLGDDTYTVGKVPSEKTELVSRSITLATLFEMNTSNQSFDVSEKIPFAGNEIPATIEFLFSIVFSKLKEQAEESIGDVVFRTAVISVPLWFISRQRQALKTASLLAGFEEVYLINETSAIALNYFKNKKLSKYLLVISGGIKNCNAAVYSNSDGKFQMKSFYGDLHIENNPPGIFSAMTNFVSGFLRSNSSSNTENIFVKVIKEINSTNKKMDNVIFLCDDDSLIEQVSKAILKYTGATKGNCIIMRNDENNTENGLLDGIGEFSRMLKENLKSAKDFLRNLPSYDFVCDENTQTKCLIKGKASAEYFSQKILSNVPKSNGQSLISFFEQATELKRFHYGLLRYSLEKGEKVEFNIRVTNEGIYHVEVTSGNKLLTVDTYDMTDEDYALSVELLKIFQKDPKVAALQQSKLFLKEIADDMRNRFEQVKVKSQLLRDKISEEIEAAMQLVQMEGVDLHTVESKTKTLQALREKRYPPLN